MKLLRSVCEGICRGIVKVLRSIYFRILRVNNEYTIFVHICTVLHKLVFFFFLELSLYICSSIEVQFCAKKYNILQKSTNLYKYDVHL